MFLDMVFLESGGDNLVVIFSLELVDLIFYVIDVVVGDKIFCKGGLGIIKLDLLVINKIDLVLMVGVDLGIMDWDVKKMWGEKFFVFINLKIVIGLSIVVDFVEYYLLIKVLVS